MSFRPPTACKIDHVCHALMNADQKAFAAAHQFLRVDQSQTHAQTYGDELAQAVYNQTYKDFAIIELRKFKDTGLGLRWRTEAEVLQGKGDEICGQVSCQRPSFAEVQAPFTYVESEVTKQASVMINLCEKHAKRFLEYREFQKHSQKPT